MVIFVVLLFVLVSLKQLTAPFLSLASCSCSGGCGGGARAHRLSSHLLKTPEGRPGMSDVFPLSGISGLSFDSTLASPLSFFCLVLLPFLSDLF